MATPKKATPAPRDEVKVAAETLIDTFVTGTPHRTLEFAGQLAAEQARAHAVTGAFPLRSTNNRLLLASQARRRNADVKSLYAGIKQWEKMGREVLEDQLAKPFKIYGSPVFRVNDPDNEGEKIEKFRRGGASLIDVFDWTQTRSTNPDYVEPDWEVPLGGGDFATLAQLTASSPIPVVFEDLASQNYHGHYDGHVITIDVSAPVANQIVELARQLAHPLLGHAPRPTTCVGDQLDASGEFTEAYLNEAEAALTGWLVAKSLGLDETVGNDVTEQCAQYLHRWTKFNAAGEPVELSSAKTRRKMLVDRLDPALKACDQIVAAYCATDRETQLAG